MEYWQVGVAGGTFQYRDCLVSATWNRIADVWVIMIRRGVAAAMGVNEARLGDVNIESIGGGVFACKQA